MIGTVPYIALFYCNSFMKRHLLFAGVVIAITFVMTINVTLKLLIQQQPLIKTSRSFCSFFGWISKAPVVISGDNVYIACWSNKTGNNEVNFSSFYRWWTNLWWENQSKQYLTLQSPCSYLYTHIFINNLN